MKEVIVRLTGDHIKVKGGEYVRDLVRCKDCKWWWKEAETCKHKAMIESRVCVVTVQADDFCSYGEVRDE